MGGENGAKITQLQEENLQLQETVADLLGQLQQCEADKLQLQNSYEEALQALADSEAKRETSERESKLAHEQIASMWKELESLHKKVNGPTTSVTVLSPTSMVNEGSLELQCTLCKEKIKPPETPPQPSSPRGSPRGSPQASHRKGSWLFRRRQRVQDLESHSKSCSSNSSSNSSSPSRERKATSASPQLPRIRSHFPTPNGGDYFLVNVTRTPPGATDLAPFKVVTKTTLPQLNPFTEVYRSQGDFQWLYEALQEACPERIVPPLKPPISLDATMSEFQRFLSRLASHKTLRKHHLFMIFLTGTAEELRSLRAKHRPRRHDQVQYKPAVGRDTNSGPLVAAKEYLITLEQHTQGLASHLEQSSRRKTAMEKTGHWFRAISESEPTETYLKRAASDLARSCEVMEGHHGDTDETLFIQNLQSISDYVRAAQGLLTRVEDAVDKFLYWDEEVNIIEAVTSSPLTEQVPPLENSEDAVFDDSGVSDTTSSSNNSGNAQPDRATNHATAHESASSGGVSNSEKWAQANEKCADAKDYLEMMCRDLSDELSQFDLHKEKELKQVLLDYAAAQLERHEKFQGKWFAMRYLLDTPIAPEKRAIQFSNGATNATSSAKQQLTSSIEGQ